MCSVMVLCLGAISNCFAKTSTLTDGFLNVVVTLPQGNWIVKENHEHGGSSIGAWDQVLGAGTYTFVLNQGDNPIVGHGSQAELYIENKDNQLIAQVYVEQDQSTGEDAGTATTRVQFGNTAGDYITTSVVAQQARPDWEGGALPGIVDITLTPKK